MFALLVFFVLRKDNIHTILKHQQKSVRLIFSLRFNEPTKEHLKTLKILTFYGQNICYTIMFANENQSAYGSNNV